MNNRYFIFDFDTHNLLAIEEYFERAKYRAASFDCSTDIVSCSTDTDHLQSMLDLQSHFQSRLGAVFNTQYIMNHILYAEAEMHEFLRELEGFKAWKQYNWSEEEKAEHLENAKEEFIDILHFIWNVAIALGLSSDDIMEIYASKNAENHARQDRGY